MASIEQLKSLVTQKDGIARGNVFRVKLPSMPGASSEEVNLLCTNVNIPGRQIMTQEKRYGIIKQKVATDQLYDDVNLTFLLLNDYGIRQYFDVWQSLCVNQERGEIGYLNDYAKDVQIQQLQKGVGLPVYKTPLGIPRLPADIQNNLPRIGPFDFAQGELDINFITADKVVYECTLVQAFPTTMTLIELSNDAGEDILRLNIQLSYKYWTSGGVLGGGGPLSGILSKFGAPGKIAAKVLENPGGVSLGGVTGNQITNIFGNNNGE